MEKKRNIQAVVKKVSFAEAEEADDLYWSEASYEDRLRHAFMLRSIQFGNDLKIPDRIERVIVKRNLCDE
ncbi:MAG: hypothetical protein KGP35_03955 [Bacteroidetes bacterium]|nr:hypothetical protein [Bacteroidota bacterium]